MKQTFLTIEIPTRETHENKEQEVENKIIKATIFLYGIFNLIRFTASDSENFADEIPRFLDNVTVQCDIGVGLVESIQKAASELNMPQITETQTDDDEENGGGDIDELGNAQLGSLFADLLNNPNLPNEMYNAILNGLDATAAVTGEKRLNEIIESADYIAGIFDDWANNQDK